MKKLTTLVALLGAACAEPVITPVNDCETACTEDADCFGTQTCGEAGLCTSDTVCTPPTSAACEPGDFLGCEDADTARVCGADGATQAAASCGGLGCNADAGRCNECAAGEATCAGGSIETCGTDGVVASTESCALGCTTFGARCKTIEPEWIPDACETPATDELAISLTTLINTDLDASCTGGVVAQTGGPEICVVRHHTISIAGSVSVTGSRPIAFVSDGALDVIGTLDVSAKGTVSGPGGGKRVSGARPTVGGGGGAGGKLNGAVGGAIGEFGTNGGQGGLVFDQLGVVSFEGGQRAAKPQFCAFDQHCPTGGGGGGALMLVSCGGKVRVSGTIDAGGGGGIGGGDSNPEAGISIFGGAGGGAGGYVVLQGAEVEVTGGVFANGGGGGGGCSTNNCVGIAGQDGAVRGAGGRGGAPLGDGAKGGNGTGVANLPNPEAGQNAANVSPGGGGGSSGRLQIYTPQGVAPVVASTAQVEPVFESHRTVDVR